MNTQELFEQVDFVENPLFENIIDDLTTSQYSIVDTFFEQDEVLQLREALLQRQSDSAFKKAAIGNRVNEEIDRSIRGDYIFWLRDDSLKPDETLFFERINAFVSYLNRTCFMGIMHKEFHYAIYPKGTFYKRHIDTFQNDDRRKLSIVFYLNDTDWTTENGGQLVLYPDGKPEISVVPIPGRMVIFESQILEHEVLEVKQGERLSITGWLKTRGDFMG
ncbi:2OG-Fe(II) oxygenase [Luteirhabdus pelagi]|uniref:2OG-Fe(II) oxygenase n=1 Tax=Luteirhabdus pelagi TaxID=2792783 RepID=UPI0019397695|nr:2OG-Fe(II) oxygenase [Luteirhabdus pelagi]